MKKTLCKAYVAFGWAGVCGGGVSAHKQQRQHHVLRER
jgi:hypothetical protein